MIGDTGRYTAKGDVSLEGLDAGYRKVAPDFVLASGHHVEEASWDKWSTLGRVKEFRTLTAG